MQPVKLDLHIVQGATLRDTIRIMQPRFEYKPITAIAATAPVRLTVEHGLPGNWLAWIEGVQKMPEINRSHRTERPHRVEVIDASTLEINALSAFGLTPEGGMLIYKPPVDLTGATVRMQIRDRIGGVLLLELSTENGALSITGLGTISRYLSDTQTTALAAADSVYDLEVKYPDGTVQRYIKGIVIVDPEVTK